jgi:hypothetical protein
MRSAAERRSCWADEDQVYVNVERGVHSQPKGGKPAHSGSVDHSNRTGRGVTTQGTPTYESTCKARYLWRSRSAPRPPLRSRLVPKPGSRFPSVTAGFALRPCTGRTAGIAKSGHSRRTPTPVPSLPHGRPCAPGGCGLACRSAGLRGVQNQRPTACRSQPLRREHAGMTPTYEIQWRGDASKSQRSARRTARRSSPSQARGVIAMGS